MTKQYHVTGSHGDDYVVTFEKTEDGGISANCTCQASWFGQVCKHIIGLIENEPEVKKAFEGTETAKLLNQYNNEQKEIKRMQAESKKTKKRFAETIGLTSK